MQPPVNHPPADHLSSDVPLSSETSPSPSTFGPGYYQPPELKPLPREEWPCIDHIVTEDGAPVDSIYCEKQMRLLTDPLYETWKTDRSFVALSNVGMFYDVKIPPIVPDMLLSVDVQPPENITEKINRSYFVWKYGKPPEVAIEIVSNKTGYEDTAKLDIYACAGISNYFVFDPLHFLSDQDLRGFHLSRGKLKPFSGDSAVLRYIGLKLTIWTGTFQQMQSRWLRWTDRDGNLILTGMELAQAQSARASQETERASQEAARAKHEAERAKHEAERAKHEAERASQEAARAEYEAARADTREIENQRLLELLRQHGIDPPQTR